MARNYLDIALGNAKVLGQNLDQCLIGCAIDRPLLEVNGQFASLVGNHERTLGRTRLHANRNKHEAKPRFDYRKLVKMRQRLLRLLRFGYSFAAGFALLAGLFVWSIPLLAFSLGVTGYLISDEVFKRTGKFNIRPILIIAAIGAMVSFAIFYAILGLALDLETSEVAQQSTGYFELAKSFGLLCATALIILATCGVAAIVRAHREIRLKP